MSDAATLPERLRAHADLLGVYADTEQVVCDLMQAADELTEYDALFDAMENGITTPPPKVVARGVATLKRVDDAWAICRVSRPWWRRHTTQRYWVWKLGYLLGLTREPW